MAKRWRLGKIKNLNRVYPYSKKSFFNGRGSRPSGLVFGTGFYQARKLLKCSKMSRSHRRNFVQRGANYSVIELKSFLLFVWGSEQGFPSILSARRRTKILIMFRDKVKPTASETDQAHCFQKKGSTITGFFLWGVRGLLRVSKTSGIILKQTLATGYVLLASVK